MKVTGPLDWDVIRDDVEVVERCTAEADEAMRRARARFLLATQGKPLRTRAKRLPVAWAALAFAASLVLGIFGWLRYQSKSPLSFYTGTEHASGHVGALLTAIGPEPLPIHFSDGTVLSMASATRARVTETSSRGANVILEEGALSVAVVHRDASSWHVSAGPYTVLVTGTQFDVRWGTREQTLSLDLHQGSVTVLGPSLGPSGRHVLSGESLRVSVAEKHEDASTPAPAVTGETGSAPAPREDVAKAPGSDSNGGAAHGSWRQLAIDGHYADALAAAESEGFDTACRHASASDLLLLGDTARFAGSKKRAEQAFQLARARFAGSHEAAISAFGLGRIAYDEHRNYPDAARWFRTYLREEPSGSLARLAAGRLIEAETAAGDIEAARASASAYLGKYPAGPHAGLARNVLNR
jgi:transmembrane sensor